MGGRAAGACDRAGAAVAGAPTGDRCAGRRTIPGRRVRAERGRGLGRPDGRADGRAVARTGGGLRADGGRGAAGAGRGR
ncbi:MAG: hypothetical protein EPN98_11230 [Phenylobacterium sp.]|nr:MAG: hypothetical protein EPN98_11230 [Phenylobacterium sp.]